MRLLCSERRSCLSAAPVARRRSVGASSAPVSESVGASSAPVSEPGRRLTRDAGRYHVAALELAVAYLVSGAFEPGDDPAAAGVDREPRVVGAVRDEDTRRASLAGCRKKPWRTPARADLRPDRARWLHPVQKRSSPGRRVGE